ncbi:hypothetical protein [Rhodococcus sp. O3]|uniref:hypothetical protein n=1 Tax=Rhodococcus sp. O3 TaxID=3404919 RepID=UPI003B68123A
MTTQDPHPGSTETAGGVAPSSEGAGSSAYRTDPAVGESGVPTDTGVPADTGASTNTGETAARTGTAAPPTGDLGSAGDVGTSTAQTERTSAATESGSRDELFGQEELSGLRSRWDEVQAGFVDDPRECVRKADGLVSDVVERLTNGFADARSRLEEQWARGDEASTEDLRLALKRYREFFQRLLSI